LPVEGRLLLGFVCALLVAYLLTPVAIRVAGRFEFYDVPRGYKAHRAPTPYLGGAAVMSGFLLALLVASLATDPSRTLPLAGGVAALWALGTVDDRRTLSPLLRVVAEALLALGLWALGLGWDVGAGAAVDLGLSIVWVVVVVNAFNLFDNMDGAASTMGFVVSASAAVLGLIEGDAWLAGTAGALAGACLGFLPHNMASPARIFLGDGGSMPLGFAVAAVTMTGLSDTVAAWQALFVGLLLVGIPLLDTALVIVSRRRRGVSILTGGQDHLTFRTRSRLRTARLAVPVLGGAQMVVAALALLSAEGGSVFVLFAVLVYLVGAGATIALLESEGQPGTVGAGRPRWAGDLPALAAIGVLGVGAGLSPFWFGFYDASVWVPIGLAVVSACAVALMARPVRLTGPSAVVLGASLALALWTLASSRWAESAHEAVLSGNRALVLVAVLALAFALVSTERRALFMVGAVGFGIAVVALWVEVRLLQDTKSLFQGGRLYRPLGYVNAEGTIFAIGLWIAFALAERRRPLVAGAGAGLATFASGLILLSQSRGAALAILVSGLVLLAVVPGRRRRVVLMAVVIGTVVVFSGPLRDVYGTLRGKAIADGTASDAGLALLGASLCAGLLWAVLTLVARRMTTAASTASFDVRRALDLALGLGAAVAVILALVLAGRIGDFAGDQYHAFVDLGPPVSAQDEAGQTRLLSGAGNRYDYWRVAWDVAGDHPVRGIGAGGFDVPYFAERHTDENVRQPHSIELQVLSETGVIGIVLLLAMIGGAAVAIVRMGRSARHSDSARLLAVAGAGGVIAWFVHTSVDWMHLMPGVTAMALCLLAAVLRPVGAGAAVPVRPVASSAAGHRRVLRTLVAVVVAASVVLAGASLARQGLAEHHRGEALTALRQDDPPRALDQAQQALRLDADDVSSYYAKAAALARFGRGTEARYVLLQAAAREPHDFVTWALLGDLEVRLGRLRDAAGHYERAHRLNPRGSGLAELARDPRSALR
jgi:UDP-GlcNAc:undecaprenyl-phosphate GlcNAc-1-phosphate transferase